MPENVSHNNSILTFSVDPTALLTYKIGKEMYSFAIDGTVQFCSEKCVY